MAFNYGQAHYKHRGKHFKLFSDELPIIEFDKSVLDEYGYPGNEDVNQRWHQRRFSKPNTDQLSLPPLGTPEWEKWSVLGDPRPRSDHTTTARSLNPNFTKINQNIRRRNTTKETKVSHGKDYSLRRSLRNEALPHQARRHTKTEVWVRKETIVTKDSNIQTLSEIDKSETQHQQSMLRKLLNAAKEDAKAKIQITQGLNVEHSSRQTRLPFLRKLRLRRINAEFQQQENIGVIGERAPEVISDDDQDNSKPGILRRGVRLRDACPFTTAVPVVETFLKPKLIHHENMSIFNSDTSKSNPETSVSNSGVRITTFVEPPLNRMYDAPFIPLPSRMPRSSSKHVNFHEAYIKELTRLAEEHDGELDGNKSNTNDVKVTPIDACQQTKPTRGGDKHTYARTKKVKGIKSQCKFADEKLHQGKANDIEVERISDTNIIDVQQSLKQIKDEQQNIKKTMSKTEENILADQKKLLTSDETNVVAAANTETQCPYAAIQTRISNNNGKVKATESSSRTSDIESLSGLSAALHDDDSFNFETFPEEIDRSLTGEELIKAYRLWDRKRRAWSKGLRSKETVNPNGVARSFRNLRQAKGISGKSFGLKQSSIAVNGAKPTQKATIVEWV